MALQLYRAAMSPQLFRAIEAYNQVEFCHMVVIGKIRPPLLVIASCLCCVPVLPAADKKVAPIQDSNDVLYVTAMAHADRPSVTAVLGRDPGVDMVVVEIELKPKGENELEIWRDDFTLISRKDGQKSQPLAPTQIAGQGALVVSSTGMTGGGFGTGRQRGPIWGGIPGSGDRPRRLGNDDEGASSATASQASATMDKNAKEDNPLLEVLKANILPEKKSQDTVKGQLYFILDGKHKLKDLELMYKPRGGDRLILDFIK
jgi:hypothetical protein